MTLDRAVGVPRSAEGERDVGEHHEDVWIPKFVFERAARAYELRNRTTSGLEKPATSLTKSAWRAVPVFSNRRPTCVLTVLSATPRASATSGMPPTSTTPSRTRSSVGVSW